MNDEHVDREDTDTAGEDRKRVPTGRNLEEIRQILELMRENDLSEFQLEDHGFRLKLKRRLATEAVPIPSVLQPLPASADAAGSGAADADDGCVDITSPIVGTFYRASSPDAEPFVAVGQEVEEDTVVCIIEAMKVMNEVKAEVRGIVRRVLIDDTTSVQYGQPLFKVEPL